MQALRYLFFCDGVIFNDHAFTLVDTYPSLYQYPFIGKTDKYILLNSQFNDT